MNTFIILIPLFLLYCALVYWLLGQFKFKEHWAGPLKPSDSIQASPLTHFVKRILDLFLLFIVLITIAVPVIVAVMFIAQTDIPTWGIDIGVFSGFKINLNELNGIEYFGVRNPEFSGKTIVNIDTSNLFAWYLFAFVSELSAITVLYVVIQLRTIVLSLQNRMSLTNDNAQRIKKMGIVIIVWNLLNPLLQYFGWGAVIKNISFNTEGILFYPAFEINLIGLIIGLMLLLLSGMLKEAADFRKEQELTI